MIWVRNTMLIMFIISLIGCAIKPTRSIRLQDLRLGMTKDAVTEKLGDPFNVIGAKSFEKGIVEVWEYRRYNAPYGYLIEEAYWVYFLNDTLEQWGRPGDWSKEADRIYELRIK